MRPCFVCGKEEPTDAYDEEYTPFEGDPGYGSRFDMTGKLRIHICDDCLEGHKSRVSVVKRVYTKPEVKVEDWVCSVCGTLSENGNCPISDRMEFLDSYEVEGDVFIANVRTFTEAEETLLKCEKHASKETLRDFAFTIIAPNEEKSLFSVVARPVGSDV